MKLLLSLLLLSTLLFSANESFSKSKKELRKIYQGHQTTIYCDCKYNYKDKKNMIVRDSCGYIPRNERTKKGKVNQRAKRIEWEHLIPAENFGRQFSCWRDGDAKCTDKGKAFKGRKCCEKIDKQYRIMQADMHNLFPAVGELNADRSNFRFDFELPSKGQYGECRFNVDFKDRRVKVREEIRGVIARDYLYFNKQYKMKLSKQELQKYNAWDKEYPADTWEIQRNNRIEKIQGNSNPFIK
ncbi:endonuclease [Candidatus Sulfurimonas marisnigri]|uniref:Endonuclease n=1 Tax=Candidatus Sulfurimonas marisnigri TaxID=2740405 RepID=A0A7S7RPX2_9BACT|nr:endonuclease [Candidatus Sulfurimonas marisnigri]QOY54014.1 endonuclease [Candidatus Sulfurimonas marisnigri]